MNYKLNDVFGTLRKIPESYIARNNIDNLFIESLEQKKHIIIHGSSKQGKTCLRKKYISDEFIIAIHCLDVHNISNISEQILKKANFNITVNEKNTIGGKARVSAKFGFNFLTKVEAGTELEGSSEKEIQRKPLDIDLSDTNDIIKALDSIKFDKIIILEDFHYLNSNTQKDIAFALKIYYESSNYKFIIIGVWLEENRLISLNRDLTNRVIPINADRWSYEELIQVIDKGCELLNIEFDSNLKDRIVEESYDNITFVQEICYQICKFYKINSTLSDSYYIDSKVFDVNEMIRKMVNQTSGSYIPIVTKFSEDNSQSNGNLYKWILYSVIVKHPSDLQKGLLCSEIKESICSKHPTPTDINTRTLKIALSSISQFQIANGIKPSIFDFENSYQKLNIVDKEFVIWLGYQEKNELLNLLGLLND